MLWNGFVIRYNFKHTYYTTYPFTAQEQSRANLVRYSAFYVPFSFFGKNLSKISRLSLEVYPHKSEEKASMASFLLR